MLTRAASALRVQPGEGRLVLWLVLLMFLPSAGGAIGSPSIEALFYARFGVQYLPYLYVALGLVTLATSLLLMPLIAFGLLLPILWAYLVQEKSRTL